MGKRVYNSATTTLQGPTTAPAVTTDAYFGSTYNSVGTNGSTISMRSKGSGKGRSVTSTPLLRPEDDKKFSGVSFSAGHTEDAGSFFARDPREALALGLSVTGKRRSTVTPAPNESPNHSFSAVGDAAGRGKDANSTAFFRQDPRERIAEGSSVSGLKQFDRRKSAFAESPPVKSRAPAKDKDRCPYATAASIPIPSPKSQKPHGKAHGSFRDDIEKETVQPEVHRFRKDCGRHINRQTTMRTPRSLMRHVAVVHTPSIKIERGKQVRVAKATNPWKVATPRPASAPAGTTTAPKVARLKLPLRTPFDASYNRNRFGPGSGRGMRPKSFVRKPSEQNSVQAKLVLTQQD